MDKRTSYRCEFRPDAGDRWTAQYRRWWSPFWATHKVCYGLGGELGPIFAPAFFGSLDQAKEWCEHNAQRELARAEKLREPRRYLELGRLP
jgi:glutathione S-transferase